MNIIQDIPLTDISQDKFGRATLVEMIVDSINQVVTQQHSCVVYGIYGKWGEGKTSLMNFVKNRLISQGKDDGINLVDFNPWLVNNDEALLREFFQSIMVDYDDNTREAFRKYGSLAIFASKTIVNAFVPGLGTAVGDAISMAKDALMDSANSLAELKKNASEAITKSRRHLVVMIDDIDRLDKEELHTTLRLIRQVADFNNCIYIIAMDVDMVAKSISEYHGNKTSQDGRKFLDKIVQVPITLPRIPNSNMIKIVKEELSEILQGIGETRIEDIAKTVCPFFSTYRELKRYCNQISFVLPNLQNEVNIEDLCLLEVIKMVSTEAYGRMYECRLPLLHEISDIMQLVDKDHEQEEAEKRYQDAKNYITEGIKEGKKDLIEAAIDTLFNNSSFNYQDDLDKKRLQTDVYFQKYFTQMVPSDLIPDKDLDEFKKQISSMNIEVIAKKLDEWSEQFSTAEVKRAVLYVIRNSANGDDQCNVASIMAMSLSVCSLSKGLPPHIYIDSSSVTAFVPNQVIHPYMFMQNAENGQYNVWDEKILDKTLAYIFETGEINYCLNLLCSSDNIFTSGVYIGRIVIPILTRRFAELKVEEQLRYSKFLLFSLFSYWKRINSEDFSVYAKNLFTDPSVPFGRVLNKFIDGTDDTQDVINFVRLFKVQIPQINERLQEESEEVRNSHAARIYGSNYQTLLGI